MMKKIMSLPCLLLLLTTACKQNRTKESATENAEINKQFVKPVNKFAGIRMASGKDTSCGMPLSAGLKDTVHLNGNVYGFCSPECKHDFVTKLVSEKKR